jgi:uncharacterized protein
MQDKIPLFPLSNAVFPDGMLSLHIFEVRYLQLTKRCYHEQRPFGISWLAKGSEIQVPGETPLMHTHGCMVNIIKFEQLQPNFFQVMCQGSTRFELHDAQPGPYGVWYGNVTYLANDPEIAIPVALQHLADRLGRLIAAAQQQGQMDHLPILKPYLLDQCGWVANRYAEAMQISTEEKLQLLCELDPLKRLQRVDSLAQGL